MIHLLSTAASSRIRQRPERVPETISVCLIETMTSHCW
ncbi:hypothetical protein AB395_00005470 (plasmid) [Sinorhizobium fredii CCBAU 45436]|nr:hypothetical protein AB395_00005470 [Sinorhizobium fredii CCBAU 45436]